MNELFSPAALASQVLLKVSPGFRGDVKLGKYGRPVLLLVYYQRKMSFVNQKSLGFFTRLILQRKFWTNWFLATFLAFKLELNLDEERKN